MLSASIWLRTPSTRAVILVALIALLNVSGTPAIGVYVTLVGGIAWVVGAVWQLNASGTGTMPRGFGPAHQD